MVHSLQNGIFEKIRVFESAEKIIIEQTLYSRKCGSVSEYSGSNGTLDMMIIKYLSMDEIINMVDNMEYDIRVITL